MAKNETVVLSNIQQNDRRLTNVPWRSLGSIIRARSRKIKEVRQSVAGLRRAHLFDEYDHLGAYITKNRFDQDFAP